MTIGVIKERILRTGILFGLQPAVGIVSKCGRVDGLPLAVDPFLGELAAGIVVGKRFLATVPVGCAGHLSGGIVSDRGRAQGILSLRLPARSVERVSGKVAHRVFNPDLSSIEVVPVTGDPSPGIGLGYQSILGVIGKCRYPSQRIGLADLVAGSVVGQRRVVAERILGGDDSVVGIVDRRGHVTQPVGDRDLVAGSVISGRDNVAQGVGGCYFAVQGIVAV